MSPEQVKDEPIDARTDLFSLGCTMYRLLTGAYAFPGVTREDRLVKRIRERHFPIVDVRPGLSYRLVEIVDRLLALSPDDRFATAAEAAESPGGALDPTGHAALIPRIEHQIRVEEARCHAQSVPEEPEAPLDSTVIESALRPTPHSAREAARLVEEKQSKPRSTKSLATHRKDLEAEEGVESGRDAQKKYRDELIQMKRAMAELRSTESNVMKNHRRARP